MNLAGRRAEVLTAPVPSRSRRARFDVLGYQKLDSGLPNHDYPTVEIRPGSAEGRLSPDEGRLGRPYRSPGRAPRPLAGHRHCGGEEVGRAGLLDHKPYRGVELTADGPARGGVRDPAAPDRRAVPLGHARLRVERGGSVRGDLRARSAAGGRGPAVRGARTGRRRVRTGSRSRNRTSSEIPEMPPLYALEPGDIAVVAVPGSTDPEVVEFLDTLGLRPGVRRSR